MHKLGVEEWLVSAVMSMYTGAKTVVRTAYSNNNGFEVKVNMLQCTRTQHTQPFYDSMDFVPDNLGEPVPEETLTNSWSSIAPYLLHPSNTIHGILPVQSTCLTIFFQNVSPSILWYTSWPGTLHFILHTFLHLIMSSFRITCPYLHSTPLTGRAIKPQRQGHIDGPIAQP